jgi:hypothetical protein
VEAKIKTGEYGRTFGSRLNSDASPEDGVRMLRSDQHGHIRTFKFLFVQIISFLWLTGILLIKLSGIA